jgi:hypothetical protein
VTAEIAILNKRGIALAADSAVTASVEGGLKVFPSANKLFTLSKYEPVGLMIYNSAEMLGIPWETAVKTYRKELSDRKRSRLQEYATGFLRFLEAHTGLYPDDQKQQFGAAEVHALYTSITNTFFDELKKALTGGREFNFDKPTELLTTIVDANHRKAKTLPRFEDDEGNPWPDDTVREIEKDHLSTIRRLRDETFSGFDLDPNTKRLLTELGKLALTRTIGATGYTGIVIAGYGEDEYFPSITAFEVFGNLGGRLRFVRDRRKHTEIGLGNNAAIVPFAQSEMVTTFMEGVDPSYQATINKAISTGVRSTANAILRQSMPDADDQYRGELTDGIVDQVLSEISTALGNERWKHFVNPILSVVGALPKAELASMAESLVNLTSMKRHVSSVSETVQGPIDVALISKGDGFVWIKRKHYFDKDLNYQFFANYFRDQETENEE